MRLIDADKLKAVWIRFKKSDIADGGGFVYDPDDVIETIDESETVEAKPVKHGRWIPLGQYNPMPLVKNYKCSLCGEWVHDGFKYCPNCGEKMDLEE